MKKITKLLIVFCILQTLNGCEKSQNLKPTNELIYDLKALNNLFLLHDTAQTNTIWPFSNQYLKQKNTLLLTLLAKNKQQLGDKRTVELLLIEQRFTERFFPWPYNSNPISNYFNSTQQVNSLDVGVYLDNVMQTMQLAAKDHIKLNRIELAMLKSQVSIAKALVDRDEIVLSLTKFELFLADYIPRRSLGLGTLPNGKDWYQTRLNYFLNKPLAPNMILSRIIAIQTKSHSNQKFVRCFITDQCINSQGIDWRSGYSDRLLEFENIKFGLEQAIIAEVDFGIHAQAWSQEHALTVLTRKLSIKTSEAEQILTKIVLEPALALVNLPID